MVIDEGYAEPPGQNPRCRSRHPQQMNLEVQIGQLVLIQHEVDFWLTEVVAVVAKHPAAQVRHMLGIDVKDRGRVPAELVVEFRAATGA